VTRTSLSISFQSNQATRVVSPPDQSFHHSIQCDQGATFLSRSFHLKSSRCSVIYISQQVRCYNSNSVPFYRRDPSSHSRLFSPLQSTEGEISDIRGLRIFLTSFRFCIVSYHQRCNSHLQFDKIYCGSIKSYSIKSTIVNQADTFSIKIDQSG
jgi:hypothetical protein